MTTPHPTHMPLEDTQPMQPVHPAPPPRQGVWPWLVRLPLLALTGLVLLAILAGLFVAAHQSRYAARIYPGVSTYGVDLSGLTHAEAMQRLNERFIYDDEAVFTFRDGERFWQMTAGELGVSFDVRQTVDTAMLAGRDSTLPANLLTQSDMWFNGRSISPVIVYDQTQAEALLSRIAREIDRPVQDASLVLLETDILTAESQVGRTVDVPATLALLRTEILKLESGAEIALVINDTPPTVWTVANAEARLRAALSGPLALFAPEEPGVEGLDAGPWTADPAMIAGMLQVERVEHDDGSGGYAVSLNPEQFQSFLQGIAPQLTTDPSPARFDFDSQNGQLVVIQDSINGRELDVEASLAAIEDVLFAMPDDPGELREVPLSFSYVVPTVHSNATGAELGITELVVEATTYYLGSTAARQANVAEAASRFHGVVIGPGEEFSFNEWLGDVSQESGFEESFIIFGGRTIKGVGGGVCQVSTTVFQAAFYGGFPILERYPHGYRVGYYEYGEGVGMDATVYSPVVDFRFLNDTPHHLLIEAETNREAATVTFRLYGTDVGRYVEKVGPRIANVTPHGDTVYEENAELRPGQTRQVEWAVDGADVTVTRQVWRNGELEQEDHFFSHYLPWNAVVQVAPGELPGSAPAE
jgi:vancomycin resistance protein YoaR